MATDIYYLDQELYIAPGETVEFEVTLTNAEDEKICEITQNYIVTVENLTGNMSLDYQYFLVKDNVETLTAGMQGTFAAGIEESATYKIKVTWKDGPKSAASAFEVDGLKLVIKTEQVDEGGVVLYEEN